MAQLTLMRRRKKRFVKNLIKFAIFCFIIGILGIAGIFAYFAKDLPDPSKIGERQVIESTKLFDRTGKILLYDIHGEEKRTIILFNEIPQYIKDATITVEDDNFYHHFGLDFRGVIRAVIANLRGQKIAQGGSTISQQYIKNAYLGGPNAQRTFSRKIKELILTLLLERKYSKDEILGFYLNQIPYGSNAYGIEAASQTFFSKSAKELNLAECTLLASLPQAPSYYSPNGSHPDELKARQEYILNKMTKFGYITVEQKQQAEKENLIFTSQENLKAYHFVTMVREYLEKKYNHLYSDINSAGLKVYTTLDWDLQQIAEKAVTEGVEQNEKKFQATNAALVSIDPKTGQLLALVGSKNYGENQFNVATSPHRQPGSSFKPFAYAAAFKKGYTPETILFDLETNFGKFGPPGDEKDYIPKNYDLKSHGPVTMKQALAQSLNVPAVKTLYLAGINDTINLAQEMGITTLQDRENYGLSLVLGGGEIKLIDETAAYGVFATEGIKHPLNMILKVEDAQGNILEEYKDKPTRVLDEQIARQISNILSDDDARAPIFGKHSKLYLTNRPAAVKTGTTQNYSDGWTVGYTPNLVTGVWAGNNDYNKKMKQGADGLYIAAPIWNDFMIKAYDIKISKLKNENKKELIENEFILPEEINNFTPPEPTTEDIKPILRGNYVSDKKIKIDTSTNLPATNSTPIGQIEEKIYKEVHCILYYVDKNNPRGDIPENPFLDEQFKNWENAVLFWVQNLPCSTSPCPIYNQSLPMNYILTQDNPSVKIIIPKQNEVIDKNQSSLIITTQTSSEIKQVDFFFDNQLINSDNTSPYSIIFKINSNISISEPHKIKVRAYDNNLEGIEDEVTIYIN